MGWMALLDDQGNKIGTVGDDPWDIMGTALDEIEKVYLETVGRIPNIKELDQIYWFVSGKYREEQHNEEKE